MIALLRAEFRKLLTVRTTYFIVLAAMAIVVLFAGIGEGFNANTAQLHSTGLLASESTNAVLFGGLILALAGLLLTGNEYRFLTIMYTLSATNRRLKVLAAKFVVITFFALVTSLLLVFFSPLCTILGAHFAGKTIGPQTFDYWSIIWKCLFCGWAYAMYAFILTALLRNQIGAIVTFLLIPLVGENILGLVLKSNTKYLPFNAAQSVVDPTALGNHTTSGHAVMTVLVYLIVGLIVSAILFVRRDAN